MINTVSLLLAKELWELGLKIETEKWWEVYADLKSKSWNGSLPFGGREYGEKKQRIEDYKNSIGEHLCKRFGPYIWGLEWIYETVPTPSTDELLAVLPARMANVGVLKIYKLEDEYDVTYASIYPQTHSILCEALGLMCKHLLTNDYEFNGKEIVRKGD